MTLRCQPGKAGITGPLQSTVLLRAHTLCTDVVMASLRTTPNAAVRKGRGFRYDAVDERRRHNHLERLVGHRRQERNHRRKLLLQLGCWSVLALQTAGTKSLNTMSVTAYGTACKPHKLALVRNGGVRSECTVAVAPTLRRCCILRRRSSSISRKMRLRRAVMWCRISDSCIFAKFCAGRQNPADDSALLWSRRRSAVAMRTYQRCKGGSIVQQRGTGCRRTFNESRLSMMQKPSGSASDSPLGLDDSQLHWQDNGEWELGDHRPRVNISQNNPAQASSVSCE